MRSYFCWQICVFPCVPKPLPFEQNEVEVANQEHRMKSVERYNQFGTGIYRRDRKTKRNQGTGNIHKGWALLCWSEVVTNLAEFPDWPNKERNTINFTVQYICKA